MFFKKVYLDKSPIHGFGLFAAEDIPKTEPVYRHNLLLDLTLSDSEYSKLTEHEQKLIAHYGYFDKNIKKWHLAHDDIRFCNHSKKPNLKLLKDQLIAKRLIHKGEELTQDYSDFEHLRKELD